MRAYRNWHDAPTVPPRSGALFPGSPRPNGSFMSERKDVATDLLEFSLYPHDALPGSCDLFNSLGFLLLLHAGYDASGCTSTLNGVLARVIQQDVSRLITPSASRPHSARTPSHRGLPSASGTAGQESVSWCTGSHLVPYVPTRLVRT